MSRQNEDDKDAGGVYIYFAMVIVVVCVLFVGRSHEAGFTTPNDDQIAEAVFQNH